jgi:hypothetical protein
MKIQMRPMDSFKYYSSKVLFHVFFISIVSSAFATLAHADPSAYYKSTTTHTTGGY